MKRIIKWHSQHLEIDVLSGKLHEEEEDFDSWSYEDDENIPTQNVMSTPFGIWRVDDSMHPYKQFKLWMAHTNFSITPTIVEMIKKTPGVEVLQVITRYRFIIGIGELFDIHDVRLAIEKTLMCNQNESDMIHNNEICEKVEEIKKSLESHNKWAIYIFPNGKIDFTTSDDEDFIKQRNLYRQAVDYSSGVLMESE